jgi:phage recombination protein Bet
MDKALVTKKEQEVDVLDESKINKYLDSFGMGNLTPPEKTQFVEIALAYKLNPFKREIYCVAYNSQQGRKLSIITGYEVYLKRAERLGDLDGWSAVTDEKLTKAVVTIHRKSWKQPFVHEVFMSEYNQGNNMWRSKPATMLKKVAIAQAFRMAFPDEFGGMPYTADELPDNMTQANPTPAVPAFKEPKAKETPKVEEAVVVEENKEAKPRLGGIIKGVRKNTATGEFRISFEDETHAITKDEQVAIRAKELIGKEAMLDIDGSGLATAVIEVA